MPPHHPIWGHLKIMGEIQQKHPYPIHSNNYLYFIGKEYNLGPVFYLDLWPVCAPMMIIQDPNLAQQVTVTHSLPKIPQYVAILDSFLGKGSLVGLEG
jgi:hypothetical protein